MSAERAIAALVYGLAEAIDDADLDRVEALFGDAVFTMAGGTPRVGGRAFRETIEAGMLLHDGSPRTHHAVTNLVVSVDGDGDGDRADARSYVTVLQQVGDHPLEVILAGRYEDRFRRVDGEWVWEARTMHVDLVGDTSRHSRHHLG